MTTILGISGSLRSNSLNTALLRAAQVEASKENCKIEMVTIEGIPLYNQDDEEKKGLPESVIELKEKIVSSDGLLIATPEYNNSIPGVLKNALDWCTRPPKDVARIFHHRKIGLIGSTPSRYGTVFSQTAWLQIFRYLKVRPYFGNQLYVDSAHQAFNGNGDLTDETVKKLLREYIQGFFKFITTCSQPVD